MSFTHPSCFRKKITGAMLENDEWLFRKAQPYVLYFLQHKFLFSDDLCSSCQRPRAQIVWLLRKHLRWEIMLLSSKSKVSQQGANSFGELNYCHFPGIFFLTKEGLLVKRTDILRFLRFFVNSVWKYELREYSFRKTLEIYYIWMKISLNNILWALCLPHPYLWLHKVF